MNQQATPLETVPDLEPGIIEKLVAAGITTVEAVADMTPEQLEEVPGIGPKTVEKISIAVNNYFSSLDAAAEAGDAGGGLREERCEVALLGRCCRAEDEDVHRRCRRLTNRLCRRVKNPPRRR